MLPTIRSTSRAAPVADQIDRQAVSGDAVDDREVGHRQSCVVAEQTPRGHADLTGDLDDALDRHPLQRVPVPGRHVEQLEGCARRRAEQLRAQLHPLAQRLIERGQAAGVVRPDCVTLDRPGAGGPTGLGE